MKKIRLRFRKAMLVVASFAMIFTSLFSITPVKASSENIYFEVNKADEVISEAQKHLGKPYVWGAAGPNSFDCSGYVSYVFKQVGLKFNADRFTTYTLDSYLQGLGVTSYVYPTDEANPANAKKGDIILYYDKTGDALHMAIYMGNGKIIHCAADMPGGPQQQVMISNADALGTKHGTTIVSYKVYRVFPESGGVRLQKTDEFGNALKGVTFEITMPDGRKKEVVTNTNGYWDSDEASWEFQAGTYSYREVSTIEGYLLDSTPKTFTVKAGVKAQQNIVSVTNKEPSGQIKIIKTNSNNDRVANTTFNVYARENITNKAGTKTHYTNGQLVQTITTENNGEVLTKNLPLGKYKVIETQVPDKYVLNTNVFNVDILYKDQVTPIVSSSVTISNKEQLGKIILKKAFDTSLVDGKTGDAYLQGNQYALIAKEKITNAAGTITYYEKDQLVSNKTTDSSGSIEWDNLPLGNYYIEEIHNNDTLQINPTIMDVSVSYTGQTVEKTIVNKVTSDKLNMQKIQVFKSGLGSDSGIYNGLANVEFTFKLKSDVDKVGWDKAIVYDVITTDKDGNATTKYLPYGAYHVKETKTPNDYIPAPDFTITINKNYTSYPSAEQIKKINVNNAPLSAQVRMVKEDFDTGKTVTFNSASFKVKDSKGNYVVQKVGGVKIDTYTTNSKNQIVSIFGKNGEVTMPLKLRAGDYTIEEIKTPNGFLELEEPVKFKIKNIYDMDMDEDQEPIITVKIKNRQPYGKLTIQKNDKETAQPLEHVEYELTAKEDVINMIDGTLAYQKGQVVSSGKTNASGQIVIDKILMGKYELKETLTNEDYVLSSQVHEVIFDKKDNLTKQYEIAINVTNIAPKGRITLIKTDKETMESLAGVIYQLTAKEDIYSLDGRNTLLFAKGDTVNKDIAEDGHYMTNELGQITIDDLPLGKYEMKEVYAIDGYVADNKVYNIDLSFDGSDKTLYTHELNLTNIAPIGEIHLIKADKDTNELLSGVTYELRAKEDIYSLDGRNTLLYAEGDPVSKDISENGLYMTNELGQVNINDLPLGKYEMKEVYALDGYVADNKVYNIDLSYDGTDKVIYTQELNLTNIAPKGEIHLIKADKDTNELLSGVTYELRAKEDIYSLDGRNTLLYEKGAPVSKDISENGLYMTNELGQVNIADLPLGKYEMKEVQALNSHVTDKTVYEIDLSYDGSNRTLYVKTLNLTNVKTTVELSKVDITNDKELVGAKMTLKDNKDNVIETWTSTETPHILRGLEVGKEYTLIEDTAPLGYVKAESITFTIKDTEEVQKVVMKDEIIKVEISKQDFTTAKELIGAKLQIIDENNKVIHEWVTNGTPTLFERLPAGKYTLKEIIAPKGYDIAEEVKFTVDEVAEVQKVVMKDKRTPIEKVETGDTTARTLYVGLLIVSGIGLAFLKHRNKKNKK